MKRFLVLIALCLSLTATVSFAQPVALETDVVNGCSNGIDDDGDGKIDCFDGNCVGNPSCEGFYIGNDGCSALPPEFPTFTMTLDFASPNESTNHIGRMAVGDMDADGIPEIVTLERYKKKLFILNGNNGTVRVSTTVTYDPIWEVAIGNIDNGNGGCAEIFFSGIESNAVWFYAYDCNLTELWRAKIRDNNGNQANALDPMNYGLADFDGDGKVELYAKDMIFDAHTGTRIINTSTTTDQQWNNINGGPVAVDMDPKPSDGKLELVIGLKIYVVNLGSRAANAGTLTARTGATTNYFIRFPYNATSVADYNLDGSLDVLASGSDRDGISQNKRTVIFFWDVKNNIVKTFFDNSAGSYQPNGWKNGTGRINIADIDGDGNMNASYVSGKFLYALDENLQLKWRKTINEETSGHTGCTLFDFLGDGSSEIVYRDERFLYIIDGDDGSTLTSQACISRTQREYPIVADVDADGSTEICVVCGFNDDDAADNFDNLNYSQYSQVRVFKSGSTPWVPARRVWNQHGYFNVNVNNDLTIPRRQQRHGEVFSTQDCFNPAVTRDIRPLNSFLNQSPFLDSKGCPKYLTADVAFTGTPTVKAPTCPEQNFFASFQITNLGDLSIAGNLPVTFYTKNPLKPGATKLNTILVPLTGLGKNEVVTITDAPVAGIGADSLYIVLNDAGTTVPTPIKLPNTPFIECNYDNIFKLKVIPLPAPITGVPTDVFKCTPSAPDNGVVSAFVPTSSGVPNTTDYNFYWEIGGSPAPDPAGADFTGVSWNQRPAGQYTVFARHKTVNCGSNSIQVNVGISSPPDINLTIVPVSPHTNCEVANGILKVEVRDANNVLLSPSLFTYEWYKGASISLGNEISFDDVADGLSGSKVAPGQSYTVAVTRKSNGCGVSTGTTLLDETVKPVVVATAPDIDCSASSTSIATADAGTGTFSFAWYNGQNVKPSADHTGPTYPNRPAGFYTVVATNTGTQCKSDKFTVEIEQTTPPDIHAVPTAGMTSCDPSQPNGAASADVGGITTGFTFEWFSGQNTLGTPIATTPSITGKAAGIYTVRVTNDVTHCSATEEVTIIFDVETPSLVIAAIGDLTNCTNANGSIEVSVDLDTPADYDFFWYDGTDVTGAADYTDTDNKLEGLPVGQYSVKAVHKTKHCETLPITAEVEDNTPTIEIIIDPVITEPPSDCNSNNGTLKVDVDADGNVGGFKIDLYSGIEPDLVLEASVTSGKTLTKDELGSGMYTIKAVNLDNGCEISYEYFLPFLSAHFITATPKVIDNCVPHTVEIIAQLTKTPSSPVFNYLESHYTIEVHKGTKETDPLAIPAINGVDGQLQYPFTLSATGKYLLVAIANAGPTTGCKAFFTIDIKENLKFPSIASVGTPVDTFCGATGSGTITLNIDGNGVPESDFDYAWFSGTGTTIPLPGLGTSHIASNVSDGTYTAQVTHKISGCSSTATINVLDNPIMITTSPGLVPHAMTFCPPTASDGGATVVSVNETPGGTTAMPALNYTFLWTDDNLVPLPPVAPATPNIISGLAPGTYYVTVTNPHNCSSSQIEFAVEDQTINSVGVELISFLNPTLCREDELDPGDLTGILEVAPNGNSATNDYSVVWLDENNVPVGVQPVPDTRLTGITMASGDTDIIFSAQVTNNTSGCTITEPYKLELDIFPVTLTASATPMTYCDNPLDGTVSAIVTSGGGFTNYNYTWTDEFDGTQYFTRNVNQLDTGNYSVTATHKTIAGCVSNTVVVEITEERVYPVVEAAALAAMRNCDALLANGSASASVGGNISDYQFSWFIGNNPLDLTTFIQDGPQANGLNSVLYSVIAKDLVTGCPDTTTVQVPDGTVILSPSQIQVTVLANNTACDNILPDGTTVHPNGALSASVSGNASEYKFFWYETDPGTEPDTTLAVFKDSNVFLGADGLGLAAGTYYVSVINRITKCPGGPTPGVIIDELVTPDFNFITEDATCKKNDIDIGDGYISIIPSGPVNIDLNNIEWRMKFDDGTYSGVLPGQSGPNLTDADAGTYLATVYTMLGCKAEKEVVLKTDIRPFNGISRNEDGMNDKFVVKCLEEFTDNIVRIFNRAGTLVYEAEHYDNIDIYFDGKSNKGISMMGTNLPDGTYFYVIDKRDGSKPVAGYLEIVN